MKEEKNIDSIEGFEDLLKNIEVVDAPKDFTQNTMRKFDAKIDSQSSMSKVVWIYLTFIAALSFMSYLLVGSSSSSSLNGKWLNDLVLWSNNLDFNYDPLTVSMIFGLAFVFFIVSTIENYSSVNFTLAK
jgi:hypothetical protein